MRKLAAFALVVAGVGLGCITLPEPPKRPRLFALRDPQSYAHLLWIPEGPMVTTDSSTYQDGSTAVGFTTVVAVPDGRVALSDALTAHFRAAGWVEQKTDSLNPRKVRTSFSAGWQRSGGGVIPNPPARPPEVHLWFGEWQDAAGNVIQYRLTTSREGGDTTEQVHAYAVFLPRALAQAAFRKAH